MAVPSDAEAAVLEEDSDEEIDTFVKDKTLESELGLSDGDEFSEKPETEPECNELENSEPCENSNASLANKTIESTCSKCDSTKAEAEHQVQQLNNSLVLLNAKIVKKEDELALWKKKFEEKCIESKNATQKIQSDMSARLDKALRMLETLKSEKEAAVMKYVVVEQEIAAKEKAVEMCEKRRLHCEKETNQAVEKAKTLQVERTRFRQLLEDKENDLIHSRKECDKMKYENATLMQKLKGMENRLQRETEAHAETQAKVSMLNQKLREMKEEFDSVRRQSQDLVKVFKNLDIDRPDGDDSIRSGASSESDISSLDDSTSSGGQKGNLHLRDDSTKTTGSSGDFEFLKRMQHNSVIEITSLREQLSQSRKDCTAIQLCLREKTEELMVKEAELSAMKSRLDAYAVLEQELDAEKAKRLEVEEKRQKEQSLVNECEQRINEYQNRERANLEYTSKLTTKITELQMEVQNKSKYAESLQEQIERLKTEVEKAADKAVSDCSKKSFIEQNEKELEIDSLRDVIKEKEAKIDQMIVDFEEKENKWSIERRKIDATLKDVTKQLQNMKKLKEASEQELVVIKENVNKKVENNSSWSRTEKRRYAEDNISTISSDLTIDDKNDTQSLDFNHNKNTGASHKNPSSAHQSSSKHVSSGSSTRDQKTRNIWLAPEVNMSGNRTQDKTSLTCADVQIAQPFKKGAVPKDEDFNACTESWTDKYPGLDKNVVVEKLIKIQKNQKRLIEKSEVLEDQVFQLTEELKKKNRIIQYYVLREETGTLGSAAGNDTILFNKLYSQRMAGKEDSHQKGSSQWNLTSLFHPSNGATSYQTRQRPSEGGGQTADPINLHFYKELNTRLQSVLEDTILKNMKLQENLDKMSSEVQSLKQSSPLSLTSSGVSCDVTTTRELDNAPSLRNSGFNVTSSKVDSEQDLMQS